MTPQAASDRGADRHRRATLTSLANVFARAVTVLTSFATIPLTSAYLGAERFGLWMTISSFLSLLAFADLGIGNGLLNAIAHASGRDDLRGVRANISSAATILSAIALVIVLVVPAIGQQLDWTTLFGLRDPVAVSQIRPALLVFVFCFALGIPLSIVARSQLGLQLGFVNGVWQAIGSLLALAAVLMVIHFQASLPWLVAALMGGPLVGAAANTAIFFGWTHAVYRPRLADVSRRTMSGLLRLGALFFILQLAVALAFAADNTIAARLLGAEAVGDYAIAAKLFAIASIVVGMLVQPLWPAYGEAMARKDIAWVRRTLKRYTMLAIAIAAGISTLLLIGFDPLVQAWVHRAVPVSGALLAGLALWAIVDAAGSSLAMFLNGAHIVRAQVVLGSIFAISCFGLKIVFVGKFGVAAMPWTTLLVYIPVTLLPVLWMTKKWLSLAPSTPHP